MGILRTLRRNGLLLALNLVVGVLLCASLGMYLNRVDFYDHIEPEMTIGSMCIQAGKPLYTTPDAPDRYSMLYGPTAYLAQIPFLKIFKDPFLGSKAYGISMFVASLLMLMIHIRKKSFTVFGIVIPYYIVMALMFNKIAFWNRPDSAMLCAVSGLILCWGSQKRWVQYVGGVLFFTLLINTKIHAVMYAFPIWVWFLCYKRQAFKVSIWVGFSSVLVTGAIFFGMKTLSLHAYLFWVMASLKHGLVHGGYVARLATLSLLLAPVIGSVWLNRIGMKRNEKIIWGALLGTMGLSFMLSLKIGAGAWYFLPFLPFLTMLMAEYLHMFYDKNPVQLRRYTQIGVGSMIAIGAVSIAMKWDAVRYREWVQNHGKSKVQIQKQDQFNDLKKIQNNTMDIALH